MYQLYRDRPRFVFAIVFANIALSLWSITLDSVINNDGVTYLAMAELYLDGDWSTANSYYGWPFYAILIAAISKISFLDVGTSAYLLNTLLATSLTLAFVAIVGELSGQHKRTLLIAAVVILLYPSLTKYRAYVIRDFGFLSFYLWSLYFLIRFCNLGGKKHLLAWLSATAISCLFRFEGIILMLVAPYFLYSFSTERIQHRKKILLGMAASIVSASIFIIWWYLESKYQSAIQVAKENGQPVSNVLDLFLLNLDSLFTTPEGQSNGYFGPIVNKLGSVLYELIRRMAVFYFFFALFAYWRGWGLKTPLLNRVWLVYVAFNFFLLLAFSFTNNLVVSRYTMATGLTLLILAPFAINKLFEAQANLGKIRRGACYVMLAALILASLDGLNVKTKKTHFLDAGRWMHENLPEGATLFSNDRLLVHYADLGPKSNFVDQFTNEKMFAHIQGNVFWGYDYFAISVTPNTKIEDIFRSWLWYKTERAPVKIFEGKNGRYVFVFNTQPHDKYKGPLLLGDD